jgi:hypothetical protein
VGEKKRGGLLNVNILFLFYADNPLIFAPRQVKSGKVKDHGHTYNLYLDFDIALGQKLNHSGCSYVILVTSCHCKNLTC